MLIQYMRERIRATPVFDETKPFLSERWSDVVVFVIGGDGGFNDVLRVRSSLLFKAKDMTTSGTKLHCGGVWLFSIESWKRPSSGINARKKTPNRIQRNLAR